MEVVALQAAQEIRQLPEQVLRLRHGSIRTIQPPARPCSIQRLPLAATSFHSSSCCLSAAAVTSTAPIPPSG